MPLRLATLLLVLVVPLSAVLPDGTTPRLPEAAPAAEGFSAERLARLHARLDEFVEANDYSGFVSLIARNGRIVDVHTMGLRDREAKLPMERDTIFRIYSMSKVVTSVAALMLVEEGRLRLEDPVARHLPELQVAKVFTGGTADAPTLVDAKRPITVRHLFTHTSGYGYGFGQDAFDTIYQRAQLFSLPTLDAFVGRVATLPLGEEPGQRFRYGINTDLLGAIVARVSGQPFDVFVRERITGPLQMRDTAFDVPAEKRPRLARLYQKREDDRLGSAAMSSTLAVVQNEGVPYPDEHGRVFPSGGGGLFSTVDDYARFGQMLLDGGELDGVRILGRKAVESMRSNHLLFLDRPTTDNGVDGFGLGGSVRLHLANGSPLGSVGQFGWSGAATTYFNIDPQEQILVLLFAQHFPYNDQGVFELFNTMMYAALTDMPAR